MKKYLLLKFNLSPLFPSLFIFFLLSCYSLSQPLEEGRGIRLKGVPEKVIPGESYSLRVGVYEKGRATRNLPPNYFNISSPNNSISFGRENSEDLTIEIIPDWYTGRVLLGETYELEVELKDTGDSATFFLDVDWKKFNKIDLSGRDGREGRRDPRSSIPKAQRGGDALSFEALAFTLEIFSDAVPFTEAVLFLVPNRPPIFMERSPIQLDLRGGDGAKGVRGEGGARRSSSGKSGKSGSSQESFKREKLTREVGDVLGGDGGDGGNVFLTVPLEDDLLDLLTIDIQGGVGGSDGGDEKRSPDEAKLYAGRDGEMGTIVLNSATSEEVVRALVVAELNTLLNSF